MVFNTNMPIIVALIIAIEIGIASSQFIGFVSRPNEKKRLYHLLILLVLIAYNIAEGFLPDPNITWIPMIMQNFLGYAFGYVFAGCCPLYFYKTMELPKLRFHGVYGFLFILIPLTVFYGILYPINQDISFTRKHTYIIPGIYAIFLFWTALSETFQQYKEGRDRLKFNERLCVYCAVTPVTITPLLGGWLGAPKSIVTPIFNIGFLIANAILMRQLIRQSKEEHNALQLLNHRPYGLEGSKKKMNSKIGKNYSTIRSVLESANQGPCNTSHLFIRYNIGYLLSTMHNCIYSFSMLNRELIAIDAMNIIGFRHEKELVNFLGTYNYRISIVYGSVGTEPLIINPITEDEYENWCSFVAQILEQKEQARVSVNGNNNVVQLSKGLNGKNTIYHNEYFDK